MPHIPLKKRILPTARLKQDFDHPNLEVQSNRLLLAPYPDQGHKSAVETNESVMTENVPVGRGIIGRTRKSVVALLAAAEPTTLEPEVLVEVVVERKKEMIVAQIMKRDEEDVSAAEPDKKKAKIIPLTS